MALLEHNPRDDHAPKHSDPEIEGEELEILFDFQNYHLPELEAKGLVEYDRDKNIVTKGPHFEEIAPLLELINEHREELPKDWL